MGEPGHLDDLHRAFEEVGLFFAGLPVPRIFHHVEDAWAPIDDLRHLTLAMGATTRAFGMSPEALLERFGRPGGPSRTRDEVDALYRRGLAAGGRSAPSFVPDPLPQADWTEETRETAVAAWRETADRLEGTIAGWPEDTLDRFRFTHPFLGELTLREWIHFSELHARHHIAVAGRRMERS